MPALGDFTIVFPIEGGLSTSFELTKKNGEESASIGVALLLDLYKVIFELNLVTILIIHHNLVLIHIFYGFNLLHIQNEMAVVVLIANMQLRQLPTYLLFRYIWT